MESNPFLEEIETFLDETGMTPTALGAHAVRDRSFVQDLREGREPRRKTVQRVREFMSAHKSEVTA